MSFPYPYLFAGLSLEIAVSAMFLLQPVLVSSLPMVCKSV